MEKTNSLTTAHLHVDEESCRSKVAGVAGRRLAGHMPALMLFFSYLERSVTGVLCES